MRQEAELDNSSEELDVMASVGAWDMVTWKNEGIAVKHEFFFINTRDKEKELPELQKRIEYINSRQTLDILRGAPSYRPTLATYLSTFPLTLLRTTC